MTIIKFMFSRKATKIDEIFTIVWHLLHTVKLTVKILPIFVAFLENMNFMRNLVESHRNLSSIRIQCWYFFQRGTNANEMIFPRSPLFHHRLCSSSNDNTHWLCKHAKHRESKLPKLWSLIKKMENKIWFFSLWC